MEKGFSAFFEQGSSYHVNYNYYHNNWFSLSLLHAGAYDSESDESPSSGRDPPNTGVSRDHRGRHHRQLHGVHGNHSITDTASSGDDYGNANYMTIIILFYYAAPHGGMEEIYNHRYTFR